MKAYFELEAQNRIVLVLEPAYGEESLLMAAFMRYDHNTFDMSVERHGNGHIAKCIAHASDAA